MIRGPASRETLGLIAGFALWSLAFALLYGAHGTLCAAGLPGESGARLLLLALWAAMLAAHAGLIVWFVRRLRAAPAPLRFLRSASLALAIAALGATAWTGLPLLAVDLC